MYLKDQTGSEQHLTQVDARAYSFPPRFSFLMLIDRPGGRAARRAKHVLTHLRAPSLISPALLVLTAAAGRSDLDRAGQPAADHNLHLNSAILYSAVMG